MKREIIKGISLKDERKIIKAKAEAIARAKANIAKAESEPKAQKRI